MDKLDKLELNKILKAVDHTLLSQTATLSEIKALCDDGIKHNTASVCIPPSFVKQAVDYVSGKISVCTVIGFPNGYNTTGCKVYETREAITNGASEIDMVINIGWLKEKKYNLILDEIKHIKQVCNAKILKVIIETCLLNDDEKIKMCEIVSKSGADYIKTSTGFSSSGATKEDIKLLKEHVAKNVKVKAAGGIRSLDDAMEFLKLGASRLGTSSIIKIINNENK